MLRGMHHIIKWKDIHDPNVSFVCRIGHDLYLPDLYCHRRVMHKRPSFHFQSTYGPPRAPFTPNQGPRPPKPPGPKVFCQICSKPNHTAKVCRWRFAADSSNNYQAYVVQPNSSSPATSEWILDTGATHHVTSDLNNLSSFYNYTGTDSLQIGNGAGLHIENIGSSSLSFSSHSILLLDILHVPTFSKNLISISKLLQDNPSLTLAFSSSSCLFKDIHTKTMLLQVPSSKGLYHLSFGLSTPPQAFVGSKISADTWHARLGHPSSSTTLKVLLTLRAL